MLGGVADALGASCTPWHNGVLFLDEVGAFEPVVLDSLRQPLEKGVIRVARAAATGRGLGGVRRVARTIADLAGHAALAGPLA